MKKRIFLRCVAFLSASVFAILTLNGCSSRQKLSEPVKFMIATDLHYISPSLLGDGSFFTPSSEKRNDGKVVPYVSALTDAFLEEVKEKKPRALILSGDLTLNGAKASHEELAEKLLSVKSEGIDVLVIPGNHDVSSTGIGFLIGRYKKIARYGTPAYIIAPTPTTDRILTMSGIYTLMPKI